MKLFVAIFCAGLQAATLQGWKYYTREGLSQTFRLLGDAAIIKSLDLLDYYLLDSPGITLALINEEIFAKTRDIVHLASFKVRKSDLDEFFSTFADRVCLPQAKEGLSGLVGFSKNMVDDTGIITFILQNADLVKYCESWMTVKVFEVRRYPLDQIFEAANGKQKAEAKWRTALENQSIGQKIVNEVVNIEHLYNSVVLACQRLGEARLIVERFDFSFAKSHDRFQVSLDIPYASRLLWCTLKALYDDVEVFGIKPWLGLEKVLRIDLVEVSPSIAELCLYFNSNAVNRHDIQRIYAGYPYSAFIEDTFYQPTKRVIPSYQIDSCFGSKCDPLASVFFNGKSVSARKFSFPNITAKRLRDPAHALQIQGSNFTPVDIVVFCTGFSCSNLPYFITRFWVDFINNDHLPEFVGHISHFSFVKAEDTERNVLLLHMPNAHASQSTMDLLEVLVYMFFRSCGIESDSPQRFLNYNSDEHFKVSVANINLQNIAFDLCNFTMKWYSVTLPISDDWIPTGMQRHLKKGSPKKAAQPTRMESEMRIAVTVPSPLVFPRVQIPATSPPPAAENVTSWDQFFSELDD